MSYNERKGENRGVSGVLSKRHAATIIHRSLSAIDPRGFTLIELLVAISLIAILMAILVPAVGRVRRQAKAMACQATVRQWGQILAAYTTESNGWLGCDTEGVITALWLLRGTMPLENADLVSRPLSLLADTESIRCCPTAHEVPPESSGVNSVKRVEVDKEITLLEFRYTNSTFGGWEIFYPTPAFHGSYGFNKSLLSGEFASSVSERVVRNQYGHFRVIDVPGRADVPLLFDCASPVAGVSSADSPPRLDSGDQPDRLGSDIGSICLNRHNGCINALFTDWSVRRVGLKELWTLKWNPKFDRRGSWTRAGGVQPEDWPRWMRNFKDY